VAYPSNLKMEMLYSSKVLENPTTLHSTTSVHKNVMRNIAVVQGLNSQCQLQCTIQSWMHFGVCI